MHVWYEFDRNRFIGFDAKADHGYTDGCIQPQTLSKTTFLRCNEP